MATDTGASSNSRLQSKRYLESIAQRLRGMGI